MPVLKRPSYVLISHKSSGEWSNSASDAGQGLGFEKGTVHISELDDEFDDSMDVVCLMLLAKGTDAPDIDKKGTYKLYGDDAFAFTSANSIKTVDALSAIHRHASEQENRRFNKLKEAKTQELVQVFYDQIQASEAITAETWMMVTEWIKHQKKKPSKKKTSKTPLLMNWELHSSSPSLAYNPIKQRIKRKKIYGVNV